MTLPYWDRTSCNCYDFPLFFLISAPFTPHPCFHLGPALPLLDTLFTQPPYHHLTIIVTLPPHHLHHLTTSSPLHLVTMTPLYSDISLPSSPSPLISVLSCLLFITLHLLSLSSCIVPLDILHRSPSPTSTYLDPCILSVSFLWSLSSLVYP